MGSDSTQFRSVAYCPFPTFGHCAAQPVSVTVTSRQAHPSLLPPAPPLVAEAAGRGDEINSNTRNAWGNPTIHNILHYAHKSHYQRNRQTGSSGSYSYGSTENHHR